MEAIKVGQRGNSQMMLERGYQKMSSSTWADGIHSVQIVLGKVVAIRKKHKSYFQDIRGFTSKSGGSNNCYANEVLKCLRRVRTNE